MATSSAAEFAIAAAHLQPAGIQLVHADVEIPEIQSTSVVDVAVDKARRAYQQLCTPLIVEDAGFGLDQLDGYPGALVTSLMKAAGPTGVAQLADLTSSRACTATTALVYADGVIEKVFTHLLAGAVADRPFGSEGQMPLWTIFVPVGHRKPVAALPRAAAQAWLQQWAAESVFAQFAAWHTGQWPPSAANEPGVVG
jgi:inosine/xanthosine triphosphate pyrophosphatase family protein